MAEPSLAGGVLGERVGMLGEFLGGVREALVHPVQPEGKSLPTGNSAFVILAPQADLEGDDHLGVVDPLDVSQVELPIHLQRAPCWLLVVLGKE